MMTTTRPIHGGSDTDYPFTDALRWIAYFLILTLALGAVVNPGAPTWPPAIICVAIVRFTTYVLWLTAGCDTGVTNRPSELC